MAFAFENKKSLGGNIWKAVPVDERKAELIAQRFVLPLPVARIIASRGIPVDDVANFINPKLQHLMPDPFCMKDMEKAAKRIAEAIVKKQKAKSKKQMKQMRKAQERERGSQSTSEE